MWKLKIPDQPTNLPDSEIRHPNPDLVPRAAVTPFVQSFIGKSLTFAGEITGSESSPSVESLFIEGSFQGSITLPDSRVTVGHSGRVTANIIAGNIVVIGQVNGNLTAMDRLEIRSQGSVTGDTTAPRISVEDGAILNGRLNVSKTETEPVSAANLATRVPKPHKIVLVRSHAASSRIHASLQSA